MVLYMQVTLDEYELPLAVADSSTELARMLGLRRDSVRSSMCHCKKKGWKCSYVKVEVEDDDDDDLYESI